MYVYILKSITYKNKYYIGITKNLKNRLQEHNEGKCLYSKKYKPWQYKNFFWFDDNQKAQDFEKYLKTSSGRAFTKKHF